MTNSLVGDHQVAVVDVDGGPEGQKKSEFFKLIYFIKTLSEKS